MNLYLQRALQILLFVITLLITASCSTLQSEEQVNPSLSDVINTTVENGIEIEDSANESTSNDSDVADTISDVDSDADTAPVDESIDSSNGDTEEAPQIEYEENSDDITLYHQDLLDFDTSSLLHKPDLSDQRLSNLLAHFNEANYNSERFQIAVVSSADSIYVLCNKLNKLSEDFVPQNLKKPDVTFSITGDDQKMYLQEEAADALTQLFQEALQNDLHLVAVSGYRSYTRQQSIYENNVATRGQVETDKISARPGHSEHQTGLAMDISCASIGNKLEFSFADTPEGIWLKENAYRFGFIIRYGQNQESLTGYSFEPWHLRYVGTDLASYLNEYQITLEELYFTIQGSR